MEGIWGRVMVVVMVDGNGKEDGGVFVGFQVM